MPLLVGLNAIARIVEASEALALDLTEEEMHYLEELLSPLEMQAI